MSDTASDLELLTRFKQARNEAAFAELVRRHLGWVHASARRRVGSDALADDVAQAVFIVLAQNTPNFRPDFVLSAWLFRVLSFAVRRALRSERRRRYHESQAAAMATPSHSNPADQHSPWESLAPIVDDAVARLPAADQNAVLLRYYEQQTYAQVAAVLKTTEEAARKRVDRAVGRLREICNAHGASFPAAAIGVALEQNLTIPAPAHVLQTLSHSAIHTSAAQMPVLAKETISMLRFSRLKPFAAAAVVCLCVISAAVGIARSAETAPAAAGGAVVAATRPAEVSPAPAVLTDTQAAQPDRPGPDQVAGQFLRSIAEGRYDDALALTSQQYREYHPADRFKMGLEQPRQVTDWSRLSVEEAWAPGGGAGASEGDQAAMISTVFPVPNRTPAGRFGIGLCLIDGEWRVRDIDNLPNAQSVEKFLSEYRAAQPDAQKLPAKGK